VTSTDPFLRSDGLVELRVGADAIGKALLGLWLLLLVATTVGAFVVSQPGRWLGIAIVACLWLATVAFLVSARRRAVLIDVSGRRLGWRGWRAAGKWWIDIDRVVDQSRIRDQPYRSAPSETWVLWASSGGMPVFAARSMSRLSGRSIEHMRRQRRRGLRPFAIPLSLLGPERADRAKRELGRMAPELAWS
jgi:hypothetical protein